MASDAPLTLDDVSVEQLPAPASGAQFEDAAFAAPQVALPAEVAAASLNPVEPVRSVAMEHDAVMAELPLANWWAETTEPVQQGEVSAALAAGVGILVRRSPVSEVRRKRNRI